VPATCAERRALSPPLDGTMTPCIHADARCRRRAGVDFPSPYPGPPAERGGLPRVRASPRPRLPAGRDPDRRPASPAPPEPGGFP
jgi:hypothetical protein